MEKEQIRLQYDKIKESLVSLITNIGQNPYRLEGIQKNSSLDSKAVEISFEIVKSLCNAFELSIYTSIEDIIDELKQTQISEKLSEIYRLVSKAGDQGGFLEAIDRGGIPPSNKFERFLSIINQQRQAFNFLVSLNQQVLKAIEIFFSEDRQLFQHAINLLRNHSDTHLLKKKTEANNQKSKELIEEINTLNNQSEKIYQDIKNKSQLAEDTRRTIERAIKIELGERYQNRAKDLENQEFRWTFASFIEFFILFCIGIYEINTLTSSSSLQWIGFIPINIAIVWAIIFTLSKRGEIAKLRYDYAHKEVFASSYLAYQHEINELKGKHTPEVQELITQLNLKLIDSMIDTLADNPAKNLDNKKKSSELPTKEIINLVSEITRIKNLTPLPYLQTQAPQSEESK